MTTYLIKMVICSGVLLLAYHLFLEREKMHRYNRLYLLFSLIFSLTIPLISFEWQEEEVAFSEPVYMLTELLENTEETIHSTTAAEQDKGQSTPIVLIVYLVVTAILFVRFVRNFCILLLQAKTAKKVPYNGSQLVLLKKQGLPFSFLNCIFVNKEEWQIGNIRPEILHHEMTHVRQKHSWDILLIELLLAVSWFNPFFYGLKKAIRLNHEFLADDAVISAFQNKQLYQQLLLDTAGNCSHLAMTSSFNYLILKKRLLMMLKTTSPLSIGLRKIGATICTFLLLFFLSSKIIAQQQHPVPEQKKPETTKQDTVKLLPWVGQTIGSTKEGVSDELLKEYEALVAKYFDANQSPGAKFHSVTEEDRARMEEIFRQMNLEQQSKQRIAFLKPPKPLPKVVPTKEQFEKFKNSKVYGVWVNEKKVPNEVLDNYNHTDFSQVFISKLYGAAKKGRSYTHQLDLMTNDHYKTYFEEASKNKRSMMVFRSPTKTRISGYE